MTFPMQYEQTNQFSDYRFEIDARNGFDDWTKLELLNYNDVEAMNYELIEIPAVIIHNSIESDRRMRTGAEEEYYLMGEMGTLEKAEEIEKLADSFNHPFCYEADRLLLADPFLRIH